MARSRHKVALGQRMTLAQHRRAWESRPLPPAKRGDDGRHSLHHVVSRICTLPPRLARHLLLTYSDPGSNVLDPFCGKGTIPVEACLQGRNGFGVDISPEAFAATDAGVRSVPLREAEEYVVQASKKVQKAFAQSDRPPVSDDVAQFFHPRTLQELVVWREVLSQDDSDAAACVKGILLGILHGKGKGFLSLRCSHSYSMSPAYVRSYTKEHHLRAEYRNVGQSLLLRAQSVLADGPVPLKGKACLASADSLPFRDGQLDLVLTSPPYLSVHRYARDNWLRLWFLGYNDYHVVQRLLFQTSDLETYRTIMNAALCEIARVLKPAGRALILVGDVTLRRRNSESLIRVADIFAEEGQKIGLKCEAILEDAIPSRLKVVGYNASKGGINTERLVVLRKR